MRLNASALAIVCGALALTFAVACTCEDRVVPAPPSAPTPQAQQLPPSLIPKQYLAKPAEPQAPGAEPEIVREVTKDGREMVTERGKDLPLPATFPRDVLPYPGASATYTRTVGDDSVMAIFEAPDPAQQVVAFYREQLEREGWTLQVQNDIPQRHMLLAIKGERRASILVTLDEKPKVTLIVGKQR